VFFPSLLDLSPTPEGFATRHLSHNFMLFPLPEVKYVPPTFVVWFRHGWEFECSPLCLLMPPSLVDLTPAFFHLACIVPMDVTEAFSFPKNAALNRPGKRYTNGAM
jgi:hypothetical protein